MSWEWMAAALFCLLAVGRAGAGMRHPAGALLGSAFCGMGALGLVNLSAGWTGVTLPLSWVTAFVSVVLGAPGVVGLLLMNLLAGV